VADASVMPRIITGPGTNASTHMIAGRAAKLVLGRAAWPRKTCKSRIIFVELVGSVPGPRALGSRPHCAPEEQGPRDRPEISSGAAGKTKGIADDASRCDRVIGPGTAMRCIARNSAALRRIPTGSGGSTHDRPALRSSGRSLSTAQTSPAGRSCPRRRRRTRRLPGRRAQRSFAWRFPRWRREDGDASSTSPRRTRSWPARSSRRTSRPSTASRVSPRP